MQEITAKLLKWAECLQADIAAGAIEYQDGTGYDPLYIDQLNLDIAEAKELLNPAKPTPID